MLRIGLDCDGVLSNFSEAIIAKAREMGLSEHFPQSWRWIDKWNFSEKFSDVWTAHSKDPLFWLNIQPHAEAARDINFDVTAYITARPVPPELTKAWLDRWGFPDAPVLCVPPETSKVAALRACGVELFCDDYEKNWVEINREEGLTCLLLSRPWNRNVDAGALRIESLREVPAHAKLQEAQ